MADKIKKAVSLAKGKSELDKVKSSQKNGKIEAGK